MTERGNLSIQEESNPTASLVMRNLAVALVVAAGWATVFTAWTPARLSPAGAPGGREALALRRVGDGFYRLDAGQP